MPTTRLRFGAFMTHQGHAAFNEGGPHRRGE
jgi:hypothetical protein